ncbi:MAG: hypothetical protein V7607_612 [Solirubrobacteraceae bacterium]
MKVASIVEPSGPRAALVEGDRVFPLSEGGAALTVREVIERTGGDLSRCDAFAGSGSACSLDAVTFAPAVPDPGAIWCAALTFMTHVTEAPGRAAPDQPLFFLRLPVSQVGHRRPLVRPAVSTQLDYEGELAVVMGRRARHVRLDEALGLVAGYSCYDEGSVRDWQRHSTQITPGKNFAATGGFGPWLVSADEFGDPYSHRITTRVNGEVRQDESIDALLFRIEYLIHYLSTIHPLEPGDVVVCGTPGGVGARREPPSFLEPGDVVTVEIDGIGTLENPVVDEQPEREVSWTAATAEAVRS